MRITILNGDPQTGLSPLTTKLTLLAETLSYGLRNASRQENGNGQDKKTLHPLPKERTRSHGLRQRAQLQPLR